MLIDELNALKTRVISSITSQIYTLVSIEREIIMAKDPSTIFEPSNKLDPSAFEFRGANFMYRTDNNGRLEYKQFNAIYWEDARGVLPEQIFGITQDESIYLPQLVKECQSKAPKIKRTLVVRMQSKTICHDLDGGYVRSENKRRIQPIRLLREDYMRRQDFMFASINALILSEDCKYVESESLAYVDKNEIQAKINGEWIPMKL